MLARQRLYSARAFEPVLWLAASLVVHMPFSPLWSLTRAHTAPLQRMEPPALLAEIPVDTTEQAPGEVRAAPPTPPEPAPAKPAEPTEVEPEDAILRPPAPKPRVREREQKPAEAAKPPEAISDAGVDAAAQPERADASVEPADAGPGGSSPLAALGSLRSVSNTVANVRLQIEMGRLREHPLAARVAALLGGVDGWRDLLRPGALDPKDIERVLVAAPSLEGSTGTVAIFEHRASSEAVRAIIDRPDPSGFPRHVVSPSPAVVVVALQRFLAASSYADPELGLRALEENEIAFAQIEKPWRAAHALGFAVPRSIRWLRLRVELTSRGVALTIEAEDERVDFARRDAEALNRMANEASEERRLENARFEANELEIRGKLSLSEAQCSALLEAAARAPQAEKSPSELARPAIATDPP
jgi:hypothetical protein